MTTEDPGHLLPQDQWDEVQRQVQSLQSTNSGYVPLEEDTHQVAQTRGLIFTEHADGVQGD